MNESAWQEAITLFELPENYDRKTLRQRYEKLLYTWHPTRYASLTNNPRKYMEMYKKGEEKTKEIHAGYKILMAKLEE